ncbi:dephospho-CoA kinase [Flavobacterium cellulosilyticum]|uniref:Dephospho-CoA kinase n=1 Tax=Flavobacterium cellulosilyticum TaxID=2541731 RepID=A0A4R5CG33_9FLAO|nr:dephospho-CoA kinase [Flavobacterium cellulosilyticum]TDD97999.1 dephospho-CoA kinase [Flavobacterium cellulosilyticum]
MSKIIGLTGGIGSGKTTIANHFKAAGVPVYIADDEARMIMQSAEIVAEIKNTFGQALFEKDVLNRQKLAEIVFNNPDKLKQLNAIIHPAVKNHFDNWILNYKNAPFIIYEAAILFESGSYLKCDQIITVIAPIESRIQRVIQRDGTTRENVLNRIKAQWNDEDRISKSDFVIDNVTPEITKAEVEKILKILNIQ